MVPLMVVVAMIAGQPCLLHKPSGEEVEGSRPLESPNGQSSDGCRIAVSRRASIQSAHFSYACKCRIDRRTAGKKHISVEHQHHDQAKRGMLTLGRPRTHKNVRPAFCEALSAAVIPLLSKLGTGWPARRRVSRSQGRFAIDRSAGWPAFRQTRQTEE